jgi:hypothetical protein
LNIVGGLQHGHPAQDFCLGLVSDESDVSSNGNSRHAARFAAEPALLRKAAGTRSVECKEVCSHSAPFRKAAEQAWRATHNGDAPFEAGFSIENDGHPGKVQLSIFTTVEAATRLTIVSGPSAMGTLHVHNKFGESTPSQEDIKSAKLRGKMVYGESRMGLYSINPDGTVHHLFNRMDWFSKKCVN